MARELCSVTQEGKQLSAPPPPPPPQDTDDRFIRGNCLRKTGAVNCGENTFVGGLSTSHFAERTCYVYTRGLPSVGAARCMHVEKVAKKSAGGSSH